MRHANGYDYWIIVHGFGNNVFYSYLLTTAGLANTPVSSAVGRVHVGGTDDSNAAGYLRASDSGTKLAAAICQVGVELFDFDPATGLVSRPQSVAMQADYYYGLEFSPDETKLYVSDFD